MTLEETLKRIDTFNKDRDWDQFHTPDSLAKSISIEAGELLECFQWEGDYHKKSSAEQEHILEELADVLNYGLQMCLTLNVNPCDIINQKIDKNALKYPVEKAKGKADKYNQLK